jgi:hypothetical protein
MMAAVVGPRGDDRRPNGQVALLRLEWLSLLPYRYCGRPLPPPMLPRFWVGGTDLNVIPRALSIDKKMRISAL